MLAPSPVDCLRPVVEHPASSESSLAVRPFLPAEAFQVHELSTPEGDPAADNNSCCSDTPARSPLHPGNLPRSSFSVDSKGSRLAYWRVATSRQPGNEPRGTASPLAPSGLALGASSFDYFVKPKRQQKNTKVQKHDWAPSCPDPSSRHPLRSYNPRVALLHNKVSHSHLPGVQSHLSESGAQKALTDDAVRAMEENRLFAEAVCELRLQQLSQGLALHSALHERTVESALPSATEIPTHLQHPWQHRHSPRHLTPSPGAMKPEIHASLLHQPTDQSQGCRFGSSPRDPLGARSQSDRHGDIHARIQDPVAVQDHVGVLPMEQRISLERYHSLQTLQGMPKILESPGLLSSRPPTVPTAEPPLKNVFEWAAKTRMSAKNGLSRRTSV